MFTARRNRNLLEAAFTTLALIYHVTVYDLRKEHRNAVIGLVMTVLQSMLFVMGFLGMYMIIGVKHSPIRGDFIIYIMSGIFLFMVHSQTAGAVSGAGSSVDAMVKHGPMNTAVMICGAALAVLYRQTFAIFVILAGYNALFAPVTLEDPISCYAMVLLAWFYGICIGLLFLCVRMWWPQGGKVVTQLYQRINMIASGKMFVANTLPTFMLHMFAWNPLFHMIDQVRGYAFINYTPHNSSLSYAIYMTLAMMMIGLMAEFVTRNAVSLSWNSGR
ncbi:ABC transporter [Paracoccus sp. (in: a-proteobacteria)]|uniref:ABC transporter permease n=1 Tax=Paracoccus sp. TaxID=267 RepID=UPI00289867C9|nr:ABC transporter [Paracoccus sp. (in: a-proteobacteria)]